MNDDLKQAYARLTAHEFLLEVFYAIWLASMSQERADQMHAEFLRLTRIAWVAADADQRTTEESGVSIAADASAISARFWDKVRQRESAIRRQAEQARSPQE